ncbi:MAG: GNAT family N-acetyltransferase [Actinobacteria bacterium]|nr:MAG: GNAT family N-acetyltransferase [Actinomycetota bacterium]
MSVAARSPRSAVVVDVILRDGATLRLRAPAKEDAGALAAFLTGLSERSFYMRFHGIRRVDDSLVRHFLEPDWQERGVLVGELDDRIVAVAEYMRLRDESAAEAAFAVADEHQRRGIGTRLLEQLALRAAEAGIERFVAEVLPENRAMLGVFDGTGLEVTRELDGGEFEVRFPIAPTERYMRTRDERDHLAVTASLRPFFEPKSVAVIGASRRRGSIGGELFRNVLAADFVGAAYPINRDAEPVGGVPAYKSVADLPEMADLAVVCLPGPLVLDAAEAALASGMKALCVISSGFAEVGAEGRERQERLLDLVRAHGGRLVGPNCLGIAVPRLGLNATFGPRPLPPGPIAFSSQSGALGLALLKFARLAQRVARRKPVLALKSGSTEAGARAASSHTAALASSDTAVEALFRQAGVIRAGTLEELVDAAALLSSQPLPRGRRVGVLTNAGGLGILCADACAAAGLELPELSEETRAALQPLLPDEASLANPVDLLGSARGATFEAVIPALLEDKRLDSLIVLFVPPVVAGADEVAAAIQAAVERGATDKPVLAVLISRDGTPAALREGGSSVASFAYPESAARALGLAAARAEWLRRPAGTVPPAREVDVAAARRIVETAINGHSEAWLDAEATRGLLEAYGVAVVPERVAQTADEAVEAARKLGLPVVLKTAAAGAHKTEQGGVALDLRDETQVRAAAERIGPPLLVQPMISGGAELLAGIVQDPVFGPLVAFGPGGVFADLIGAAAFRIAPLTDVDAKELVQEGKAGRLVAGFRGAPAADAPALVELLHRLSRLAQDVSEVAELDLNPVIALPDGYVAVDARVRVAGRASRPALKSW